MLADGTRPRILSLLKERGHASVEELAQGMGLASTTIRRHLDILQRDRLVDLRQNREHTGRPQNHYFLTEEGHEAQPKGYDRLLVLLLGELSRLTPDDLSGLDGDGLSKLLFSRMAERTIASLTGAQETDPEARLTALLQWLAERDFQPEAEKVAETVRITLHNCPFRLGALSNQNVCLFDKAIISLMLNTTVNQELCIRNGDRTCCYMASAGLGSSHHLKPPSTSA